MTCLQFSDVSRCPGTFLFFSSSSTVHSILVGMLLSLQFTDSPLEHAICHLLENGRCKPQLPWLLRKPSFPDFLATRFSQIPRSFSFFGNVKNLKCVFFFLSHRTFYLSNQNTSTRLLNFCFLRAFRHLGILYILSLVFIQTGNRKSELCNASMVS